METRREFGAYASLGLVVVGLSFLDEISRFVLVEILGYSII
jgi:hypothetical protein